MFHHRDLFDYTESSLIGADEAARFFLDRWAASRFWEKVIPEPNSGCFLWLGALNDDGYPIFKLGGIQVYAHRLMFLAFHGPIAPELEIDHRCRTRSCVLPFHLEAVAHAINISRIPVASSSWKRRVVPASRDVSRRTS